MLKQAIDFARQLLSLSQDSQRNTADIKELRQELKELRGEMQRLVLVVQKLSFDIERVSENDRHEREKQALLLRSQMLEFERRLPSGQDKE